MDGTAAVDNATQHLRPNVASKAGFTSEASYRCVLTGRLARPVANHKPLALRHGRISAFTKVPGFPIQQALADLLDAPTPIDA